MMVGYSKDRLVLPEVVEVAILSTHTVLNGIHGNTLKLPHRFR